MIWDSFFCFAIVSFLLWTCASIAAWYNNKKTAVVACTMGLLVFGAFIAIMWIEIKHPPLRTMGETRLWYSLLLSLSGLLVYLRWHYRWILSFSTIMSTVFMAVNIFKPELHTKTLMPALQSPWFAPHVIVYMLSYSLMGAATLMALYHLIVNARHKAFRPSEDSFMLSIDELVRAGLVFLTFGMLFGAMWAKEAWGHYWTWDPKETWASITWLAYLIYIHYRHLSYHSTRIALSILIIAFLLLQMCWWGINYLPSANGYSVHTYSS